MKRYLWRRALGTVPLFILVTFLTFWVVRLSPGSPAGLEADSRLQLTAEAREKMAQLYGLDKPLIVQYGDWLSRLVRFDFGRSFADGQPAAQKIAAALPITAGLNFLTLWLAFWIGTRLGLFGALHAGSRTDRIVSILSFAALSIPAFWLALLLVHFFGVRLGWFPVTGLSTLFAEERSWLWRAGDVLAHLVLPVFASVFGTMAAVSRYARTTYLDVRQEPYVRTARAAGLDPRVIRSSIILPNGLLPLITLIGLSVPAVIGGSVIFESIFSIPGMGRLFYQAVFQRDYPVILGVLVLGSFLTILGNFLADIGCALADPRVRAEISK